MSTPHPSLHPLQVKGVEFLLRQCFGVDADAAGLPVRAEARAGAGAAGAGAATRSEDGTGPPLQPSEPPTVKTRSGAAVRRVAVVADVHGMGKTTAVVEFVRQAFQLVSHVHCAGGMLESRAWLSE